MYSRERDGSGLPIKVSHGLCFKDPPGFNLITVKKEEIIIPNNSWQKRKTGNLGNFFWGRSLFLITGIDYSSSRKVTSIISRSCGAIIEPENFFFASLICCCASG